MGKSKKSSLGVGGLHRRATKWDHGSVPENLLGLCREYVGRVAAVHALVRSGRSGFKHVGLELEVDRESPPNVEDFAGAVLAMMVEHAKGEGVDHFRVDFFDENMDKLADLPMKVDAEGEVDELADGSSNVATKVLLRLVSIQESAIDKAHGRYAGLLDKLEGLVEQVALAMEALSGAVAKAAESELANAEAAGGRAEADHKHERDMKLLDLLIARVGNASTKNPLDKLMADMPPDVKAKIRDAMGDDWWDALELAVKEKDPAKQAEMLAALLKRVTPEQRERMTREVPADWQAKMYAAFEAVVLKGAAAAA